MKRRIMTLLMTTVLAISLVACNGKSADNNLKPETKEPTDLSGTWKSEENDGAWIEATISEDIIEINWISDGGDTRSVYWVGTYEAPTEYVEEYSWLSERDKEKTDRALLASTDDTKEFTYEDETINYEASMMGTTTVVHLVKE